MIKLLAKVGSFGEVRTDSCIRDCVGCYGECCSAYDGSTFDLNNGMAIVSCKRSSEVEPAPRDDYETAASIDEIGWRIAPIE